MPNTLLTPATLAQAAALTLENRLYTGAVMEHNAETSLASKIGDTVRIQIPADLGEARDFNADAQTIPTDLAQRATPVTLTHHFYQRIDLTTREQTLQISDFTRQVLLPAIDSLLLSIERANIKTLCAGAGGFTGTDTTRGPTTLAHLAAVNKWFTDRKIRRENRYAFVDSATEAALLQLDQFTSTAYGPDSPATLREANLGRRMGIDWITNPELQAIAPCGAATKAAATAKGSPAIALTGITAPLIPAGAKFTIAGTLHTAALDAPVTAGAATVTLTAPLEAAVTAGAEATWVPYRQNIALQSAATAMAIVAPDPLPGMQSAVQSHGGISLRVSMDSDISRLSSTLVVDLLYGAAVINPAGVAIMTA